MKNEIIQSANFITEASDLSGKMLGKSIESSDFARENALILARLCQTKGAHGAFVREYSAILAELVKRETIARIQKQLDHVSTSNF